MTWSSAEIRTYQLPATVTGFLKQYIQQQKVKIKQGCQCLYVAKSKKEKQSNRKSHYLVSIEITILNSS